MDSKFVTAINCMDGRVQEPVIERLKEDYKADYVDMITAPGPNLILAQNENKEVIGSIKEYLTISVDKHGSNLIAIVGHYDCAGNLKAKEGQIEDINSSIKLVKSWELDAEVIGIWVCRDWKAKVLSRCECECE